MKELLLLAGQNTLVALALAIGVYGFTRLYRNPPLAHLLWLLVLVKLVTPPLVHIDLPLSSALRSGALAVQSPLPGTQLLAPRAYQATTNEPARTAAGQERVTDASRWWELAPPIVFGCWLIGASAWGLIATVRILRFENMIRGTLPACERLQQLNRQIARRLGVRRVPQLRRANLVDTPLLWCAGGRPTILLPTSLTAELDDQRLALILAHELAHMRRRDHWVRGLELLVSIAYWWNPLVPFVRRQLHLAEDQCCDAWVRWSFPDSTKRYAELLLQAAETLSTSRAAARLLPASRFLQHSGLKARIEMIFDSRFTPTVSRKWLAIVALAAFLVLPSFLGTTQPAATAAERAKSEFQPAADAKTAEPSDFPFAVKFEQGVTKFADDDDITITEIRGTANTFLPGHIYLIKGTYKLASHDKAMLAAYTTAMEAKDGTGMSYRAQTRNVDRGSGTFTLFFPMACRGWPHVSFYDGEGFGGNYFGTGDSVLKRWWGSKD